MNTTNVLRWHPEVCAREIEKSLANGEPIKMNFEWVDVTAKWLFELLDPSIERFGLHYTLRNVAMNQDRLFLIGQETLENALIFCLPYWQRTEASKKWRCAL
jgi:hypothetical protein